MLPPPPHLLKQPLNESVFINFKIKFLKYINGTVSVISSYPPCKDVNARFTTVLLKALSDQVRILDQYLKFGKLIVLNCGFSTKVT